MDNKTGAKMPSGLTGEIKNESGVYDGKFLKAIERLMNKHKVNYVHLFWAKFK